jgi:serine protease Do
MYMVTPIRSRETSGGPVCNEQGDVIGIATFGSIEYRTGVLASGMNFSIPVDVLDQFLDSVNIKPAPGKLFGLYEKAMAYYDAEEYKAALKKLKQIRKLNDGFPGLTSYINDCNQKINLGKDKTAQKVKLWLLVVGLFVLMILLLWFRRSLIRKKKESVIN